MSKSRRVPRKIERLETRRLLVGGASGLWIDDANMIDVSAQYGAIPNDGVDDTAAIQQALSDHVGRNRILFLRDGVYDLSDTLAWVAASPLPGGHQNHTTLRGESQHGTILRLADNATGFDDPDNLKVFVDTYFGNSGDAFGNYVEDLSIEVGAGNPGAIGLEFQSNNYGSVRDVSIRSLDPNHLGHRGLALAFNFPGPMLIQNVEIDGFKDAIGGAPQEFSVTFENLDIKNQTEVGIRVWRLPMQIRNLTSTNDVPALLSMNNPGQWGHVVVDGATLIGTDPSATAIVNEVGAGQMVLRDIHVSGYSTSVDNAGTLLTDPLIDFYSADPIQTFGDSPASGLDLPVETYPYASIPLVDSSGADQWISPLEFGGTPNDLFDDTDAIQAAMNSGEPVVYLPSGSWVIRDTITVPPHVRQVIGFDARLSWSSGLFESDAAMFKIVGETDQGISFEKIETTPTGRPRSVMFEHASTRPLAFRDVLGGTYRNTVSGGKVFVDNLTGGLWHFRGQQVWARQMNLEPSGTKIINESGDLWILGLKTEKQGILVDTRAGGRTEVLGGLAYPSQPNSIDVPMFRSVDSSLSFTMPESAYLVDGIYAVWVEETRDGVIERIERGDLPRGHSNHGRQLSWYTGVITEADVPGAVSGLSATPNQRSVTLDWDPESSARRYLIYRNDTFVAATLDSQWTDDGFGTGLNDGVAYQYEVIAENALAQTGPATIVDVTTATDRYAPQLIRVDMVDSQTATFVFDEPIEAGSATWTLDSGTAVQSVTWDRSQTSATLRFASDLDPVSESIHLAGITDQATTPNPIGPYTTTFSTAPDPITPITVRTWDGNGADTFLAPHRLETDYGPNDRTNVSYSPSGNFHGAAYVRLDLSGVDLQTQMIDDATFNLTLRGGASGSGIRVLNVFGVHDDANADQWIESGDGHVTWDTAVGNTGLGRHADGEHADFLGTITVDNTGFAANGVIDGLELDDDRLVEFLQADSDGLVTFLIKRTNPSNEQTQLYTKEGDPSRAPALHLDLVPRPIRNEPVISEVVFNQGNATRSLLNEVEARFSEPVQIDFDRAATLEVENVGTGQIVPVRPTIYRDGDETVLRFGFDPGDGVTGFGSLVDGQYRLRIPANAVVADTPMSQDVEFTDGFFRKYGDDDGNGQVGLLDFARFRGTFGKTAGDAGFLEGLDANGDGVIGLFDFAAFRGAYGN